MQSCLAAGKPVLLVGGSGVGKSAVVKVWILPTESTRSPSGFVTPGCRRSGTSKLHGHMQSHIPCTYTQSHIP